MINSIELRLGKIRMGVRMYKVYTYAYHYYVYDYMCSRFLNTSVWYEYGSTLSSNAEGGISH